MAEGKLQLNYNAINTPGIKLTLPIIHSAEMYSNMAEYPLGSLNLLHLGSAGDTRQGLHTIKFENYRQI